MSDTENAIIFTVKDCSEEYDNILKLCSNGDIFVKGKLIENDKEVVDGLREFLRRDKATRPEAHLTDKIKECPVCRGHGDYHFESCKRSDI